MKRPIELEDIEESEPVRRIPRESITEQILEGVRALDERKEIEPFLRDILHDTDETPHTSTEIADILTTHVAYGGRPHLAAFVIKGKSARKITARNTSHQIVRLGRIRTLGLMVLLAVVTIQDDAKETLLAAAHAASTDYMIIDAIDVARLFIAHHKICPNDGSSYENGKCRQCGTAASEPLELTLKVSEEPRYEVLSSRDVSTALAKRYRAEILTDPHYSKASLREVVKKATWELRQETFHRSEQAENWFGSRPTDCVLFFVFPDARDRQQNNWICRAFWIRPDLPEDRKPCPLLGDIEWIGEIAINWNNHYHSMREHWRDHVGNKGDWLRKIRPLVPKADALYRKADELSVGYKRSECDDDCIRRVMGQLEPVARRLLFEADDKSGAPLDCEECDSAFYSMICTLHNIFVPFSNLGQAKWNWKQKLFMMETYLQEYKQDRDQFAFEWRKLGQDSVHSLRS